MQLFWAPDKPHGEPHAQHLQWVMVYAWVFVSCTMILDPVVMSLMEHLLLQGCGFDTVGSAAAYNNASDFLLYFTQVHPAARI